ncbi:hypothetical protein [Tenacibaculum sp. MAR_2009_124]|nr:hypothetical protein [Tenacibaculum sp. MAR_2009_124]SEB46204.1 hypothetical protein SAMN04489761_0858 [Tenacibaculum sp. MAR_2009_124]
MSIEKQAVNDFIGWVINEYDSELINDFDLLNAELEYNKHK